MLQGNAISKRTPLLLRQLDPDPLDALAARVVLFLLFFTVPGVSIVPALTGVAVPLMLTTFFRPTLKSAQRTGTLAGSAALAVVIGIMLRWLAPDAGATTSSGIQLAMILVWVAAFPALVLAGYWALERMDLFSGLRMAFLGATISVVINEGIVSWKGDLGIYATLLLLAMAARNVQLTRIFLIVSAVGNALDDSRTMALVCAIVFLCTYVSNRQLAWVEKRPGRAAVLLAGGFLVMSFLMAQAMLSGLLGQDIRRRTLLQVSGGRDLITAGRTEWAATLDLFKHQPWGFGAGVTPSPALQPDALNAVQLAGGDYTNMEYWQHSVFGERTDLHSTLADLWAHFSVGGVSLAVVIAIILLAGMPYSVSYIRVIGAAPLFAILTAAWDLLFSPMGNSDRIIAGLLLAVVLTRLHASPDLIPDEPRKRFFARKLTHYEATLEAIARNRLAASKTG